MRTRLNQEAFRRRKTTSNQTESGAKGLLIVPVHVLHEATPGKEAGHSIGAGVGLFSRFASSLFPAVPEIFKPQGLLRAA